MLPEQSEEEDLGEISEDTELTENEFNDGVEGDINENDGEIPKEVKVNYNPQYYKVQDRVKLLKHR